jgi:threonylcarbamoyladenosine tRNA methylthiotransferase CDKAL1
MTSHRLQLIIMAITSAKPEKIFVRSYGCASNFADGEVIGGCLSKEGYNLVSDQREASILIFNTCAVKTQTENKIINALKNLPKEKKLVITGCLPLINLERLNKEIVWHGLTGPSPGQEIIQIVERVSEGKRLSLLRNNHKPHLSLPRLSASKTIRTIPICYGCDSHCTYCCVNFARGPLRSYEIEEIRAAVEEAINEGFKEIWLTGQDLACYGKDNDTNLIELLEDVIKIEGDFLIRLGMMNPANVMLILQRLTNVYKDKKIFKFLHLPIQSGDDTVLNDMNRLYTVDDIRTIFNTFKENIGRFTLGTDIIYGFPTETETSFRNTLNLLREIKPDVINTSRYFPRPKTPLIDSGSISLSTISNRSQLLNRFSTRITSERNKEWLNWEGPVIVDEAGPSNSWISRNFAYKPIAIKTERNLLGAFTKIHVTKYCSTFLEGIIKYS